MNRNFQTILTTLVLFLTGLLVGVWTQHTRPLPPPPLGPMGEFSEFQNPVFGNFPPPRPWFLGSGSPGMRPPSPEEIRKQMAILAPQIEIFQKQLNSIEHEFRTSFEAILNPGQRDKIEAIQQRLANLPPPLPGCFPEMGPIFVSMVIYRPLYGRLTADLTLNKDQSEKLLELLGKRRTELLDLVDNVPPPSFKLGDLGLSQNGTSAYK